MVFNLITTLPLGRLNTSLSLSFLISEMGFWTPLLEYREELQSGSPQACSEHSISHTYYYFKIRFSRNGAS